MQSKDATKYQEILNDVIDQINVYTVSGVSHNDVKLRVLCVSHMLNW